MMDKYFDYRKHRTDFKTEMKAGHGGKTGRDSAIEEIAFDYAFALKISKNTPCL